MCETSQQSREEQIIDELQRNHRHGEWHARRGVQQDYHCVYCDLDYLATYNAYRSAELDHIIPQSADGGHNYENIAVCCRTCNLLKMDYVPVGDTREQRIADARRYIQEARAYYEAEIATVRLLVRGR